MTRKARKSNQKNATLELIFDTKQMQIILYPNITIYILNIVKFRLIGTNYYLYILLLVFMYNLVFSRTIEYRYNLYI